MEAFTILSYVSTILTILILLVFLIYSSIFTISDLFPVKWKFFRKIKELRIEHTLEVLDALGIDTKRERTINKLSRITTYFKDQAELEKTVDDICKISTLELTANIGKVNPLTVKRFVNIMGNSVNSGFASQCAHIITQKLEYDKNKIQPFDFICTPKNGSPIIGYEVSKLLDIPLLLHKEQKEIEFKDPKKRLLKNFDGKLPEIGMSALIVDDSTTTGSKMLKATFDLRKAGYKVSNAIIIFEPQGKDARKNLSNEGVVLSSIKSYDLTV